MEIWWPSVPTKLAIVKLSETTWVGSQDFLKSRNEKSFLFSVNLLILHEEFMCSEFLSIVEHPSTPLWNTHTHTRTLPSFYCSFLPFFSFPVLLHLTELLLALFCLHLFLPSSLSLCLYDNLQFCHLSFLSLSCFSIFISSPAGNTAQLPAPQRDSDWFRVYN